MLQCSFLIQKMFDKIPIALHEVLNKNVLNRGGIVLFVVFKACLLLGEYYLNGDNTISSKRDR